MSEGVKNQLTTLYVVGPIAGMTGSPMYVTPPSCVPLPVVAHLEFFGARNDVVV